MKKIRNKKKLNNQKINRMTELDLQNGLKRAEKHCPGSLWHQHLKGKIAKQ